MLGRPLPVAVPNHDEGFGRESWLGALLLAPFGTPPPTDAEVRERCAEAGRARLASLGRVAVRRLARRERQLIRQVVGALSTPQRPASAFGCRCPAASRAARRLAIAAQDERHRAGGGLGLSGGDQRTAGGMIGSRLVAPSAGHPVKGESSGRPVFPAGSARWRFACRFATAFACARADRLGQVHAAAEPHHAGHAGRPGGGGYRAKGRPNPDVLARAPG